MVNATAFNNVFSGGLLILSEFEFNETHQVHLDQVLVHGYLERLAEQVLECFYKPRAPE